MEADQAVLDVDQDYLKQQHFALSDKLAWDDFLSQLIIKTSS